jgi:hypothetical protein
VITLEDFRDGKKVSGPSRLNLVAFDKNKLRAVASVESKSFDIATGLLAVFELDFSSPFARETRFNTAFDYRKEVGWSYDHCIRRD